MNEKDLVPPSNVDIIEDEVFCHYNDIKSLEIINGVKVIGNANFKCCNNLKWVKLPASVNQIDDEAFGDCKKLEYIEVDPGNPTFCSIDGVLFRRTPFQLLQYPMGKASNSYSIPLGVIEIGDGAFSGCAHLTEVAVPDSVRVVGDRAFDNCSNLISLMLPDSVETIGMSAFNRCSSLSELTLPNGLTQIPVCMLADCSNLQEIRLPDSVRTIGCCSFSGCGSLKQIYFPRNVEDIATENFDSCPQLSKFEVASDNPSFREIDGALYSNDGEILVCVPPNYPNECFVVPSHVCEIGDFAFFSSLTIANIVIPDIVRRIGYCAFVSDRIQEIKIPKSVVEIAYDQCVGSIALREEDEESGETDIVSVFSGCPSLTKIEVDEGNPLFCSKDGVLFTKNMSKLLFFPRGCEITEYSIPEGVKCVGNSAFASCNYLKRVTIPSTVISIESWAFAFCEGLSNVRVPSSVRWVAETAFASFNDSSISEE